jgi:hypothetical protein
MGNTRLSPDRLHSEMWSSVAVELSKQNRDGISLCLFLF